MSAPLSFAETLGALGRAFPSAAAGEPANPAALAALERRVGPLPEALRAFFETADGIDLALEDEVCGEIFSTASVARVAKSSRLQAARRLPVRSDGCGGYDCVDVGDGPTRGAVFFHDGETGLSTLLGSSFAAYFSMWSDHVRASYRSDGTLDPAHRAKKLDAWPWIEPSPLRHPWPHDEAWLHAHDPAAAQLAASGAIELRRTAVEAALRARRPKNPFL